jgi:hypothetical protein
MTYRLEHEFQSEDCMLWFSGSILHDKDRVLDHIEEAIDYNWPRLCIDRRINGTLPINQYRTAWSRLEGSDTTQHDYDSIPSSLESIDCPLFKPIQQQQLQQQLLLLRRWLRVGISNGTYHQ